MDVLILIGRILFAYLFLVSAVNHFTQTEGMTAYAQSRGVPAPRYGVLASGAVFLVGGLSVLLGIWADLGALLLFLVLAVTAVVMHPFWRESGEQSRQQEMIQFNKDIALAGAALALFGFFAAADPGLTATGSLFGAG